MKKEDKITPVKQEFNHLWSGIANTKENRDKITKLNTMARESNSMHRYRIKYRRPKEGTRGYMGGSCAKDDAQVFSVYLKLSLQYSQYPDSVPDAVSGSNPITLTAPVGTPFVIGGPLKIHIFPLVWCFITSPLNSCPFVERLEVKSSVVNIAAVDVVPTPELVFTSFNPVCGPPVIQRSSQLIYTSEASGVFASEQLYTQGNPLWFKR